VSDRARLLGWLALAAAACTLVVIVASATVRHSLAAVGRSPETAIVNAARIAHRLAATVAALLVLAMVVLGRGNGEPRQRALSRTALVLVAALAVFGAATASSPSPLVPLGNLLGGYALFALLAVAHSAAGSTRAFTWARLALLLVFVQAAQVALAGAPLPMLPWLHRAVAVGIVGCTIVTAWMLPRPSALLLGLSLAASVATGFGDPRSVALAVAHNASAALLAALLARVAVLQPGRDRPEVIPHDGQLDGGAQLARARNQRAAQ
jgi:hypothetical protein